MGTSVTGIGLRLYIRIPVAALLPLHHPAPNYSLNPSQMHPPTSLAPGMGLGGAGMGGIGSSAEDLRRYPMGDHSPAPSSITPSLHQAYSPGYVSSGRTWDAPLVGLGAHLSNRGC